MGDDPMALLGLEGALKHYYYYYKWFKLADGAGLTVCLPAIAQQIKQNTGTCANDENLEGLSLAACKVLLKAVVS
jgi:hypothetical protein